MMASIPIMTVPVDATTFVPTSGTSNRATRATPKAMSGTPAEMKTDTTLKSRRK